MSDPLPDHADPQLPTVGITCDDCGAELFRARVLAHGPHGQRLLAHSEDDLRTAQQTHDCPARMTDRPQEGR